MALLGVLLEGAKERAQVRGDIETLRLLLSIGKDVTTSYLNVAPNNQQINQRLVEMNNDLNRCLNMLQKQRLNPKHGRTLVLQFVQTNQEFLDSCPPR